VVLIHFPIALFIVGVAFDFVAQWTRKSTFSAAAYYNLIVAAFSTLPVVTGVLAWQFQLEGQKLKGVLLLHLLLGGIASAIIWLVLWVHYRDRRGANQVLPIYRLPIELLGVFVLTLTGHLGGFLSGINFPN
jgi:uncharacterized membrane protein